MTEIIQMLVDALVLYLKQVKTTVFYTSTVAALIAPSAVLLAMTYVAADWIARGLFAHKRRTDHPDGLSGPSDDDGRIEDGVCC